MNVGPNSVGQLGLGGYRVSVNPVGKYPVEGGVTFDWSSVTPVGGKNATGTITVTAVSGNITLVVGGQTATVAYDASAATIEAAMEALSTIGNGNIRIGGTGPFTYEFIADLAKTAKTITGTGVTIDEAIAGVADAVLTLAGGINAPIGEYVLPAGSIIYYDSGTGKYKLATSSTTLKRGECYVTDRHYFKSIDSDQMGDVFDAGLVFFDRLQIGGSLPSESTFLAAFPRISLRRE